MLFLYIILALWLLWLLLILPPPHRRSLGCLADFHYAHRGLWNEDRPENSLPAFHAAVEHGFGMELDVHITKDDHLVVFHDDTLTRICGDDRRVEDLTLAELRQLRLNSSDCLIPTLDEVLAIVQGQTPLLIEIKPDKRLPELCSLLCTAMQAYGHPDMWMIESFHPIAVKWFRQNAPSVIRGQLAYGLRTRKKKKPLDFVVASLLSIAVSRPDFVAYCADDEPSLPMRWLRLFRPTLVAWTVHSQQQFDTLSSRYCLQIFEGFIPKR